MTNNPRKVEMMEAEGIAVAERVPLVTGTNRHNAHYLEVKKQSRGICFDAGGYGPDPDRPPFPEPRFSLHDWAGWGFHDETGG
jgi:hypothetical protein